MLHVVDFMMQKQMHGDLLAQGMLMCEKKDYVFLIGCDGLSGPAKANLDVQP